MLTKSGYFVLIGVNVMNSFQVDLNTNVKICFFRRCTDTFLGFRDKKNLQHGTCTGGQVGGLRTEVAFECRF